MKQEKKVDDIDNSQKFISDQYEGVAKSVEVNKHELKKVQGDLKTLSRENERLKENNDKLKQNNDKLAESNAAMFEDVLDLKCRSMQDNLHGRTGVHTPFCTPTSIISAI